VNGLGTVGLGGGLDLTALAMQYAAVGLLFAAVLAGGLIGRYWHLIVRRAQCVHHAELRLPGKTIAGRLLSTLAGRR
jgi:hypothetical protein